MRQFSVASRGAGLVAALATVSAASVGAAPPGENAVRPVATYSIVAFDPATKQLGVAVQSHWFSVGPVVPWVEAGVGAVATQSLVDVSYGPLGLELLRAGRSPADALKGLVAADAGAALRQVALIDASGAVAAHTGERCIEAAGHQIGANYSVQANLMASPTVWPAMARAFEAAKGDLAARMLAALVAAEAEGGDIRGRQSAALIVAGPPTGRPWQDRLFDLRVEDHPEPLSELARLLQIARAYRLMNEGDERLGKKDVAGALSAYSEARALHPGNEEIAFWTAVTLASEGHRAEALPLFAETFGRRAAYREVLPRLVRSGLFPDDPDLLKAVLALPGAPEPVQGGLREPGSGRPSLR